MGVGKTQGLRVSKKGRASAKAEKPTKVALEWKSPVRT